LIIRDFRKEDFEGVIECTVKSFADEFDITGFDPDKWRKLVRRRFSISGKALFALLRLFNREPMKFLVADVDGKVVGTTMLSKRKNGCYISIVMTHPDFRRKGIAMSLLKTAVDYARKRKLANAILHVSSVNDSAKDLYRKLGFEKFEESLYLTAPLDSLIGSGRIDGVQVRDYQKSDEDLVYELIKRSRDPKSLEIYGFRKKDLRTPFWDRMFRFGTMKKIVAVQDKEIVGHASISYTSKREAGHINSLDISPEMVSKGVAEELVKTGANFVRSCGTTTVLVVVALTNEELVRRLENLGLKRRLVFEGMVLE